MTFRLQRLGPGDEGVLDLVASDVFDGPVRLDRLAAYLAVPGHLMAVAVDGDLVVGQCAGVVHLHPDKAAELYVDEVGTASSHLRQGIATAMMAELFAWGRALGCEEAWLGTETDNEAANGLYRSIGSVPTTMPYHEFTLVGREGNGVRERNERPVTHPGAERGGLGIHSLPWHKGGGR